MNLLYKHLIKPITVGITAGLLILCDVLVAHLLSLNGAFAWVAFISWTVFSKSDNKQKLKAFPGFVLGFAAANLINLFADTFSGKLQPAFLSVAVAVAIVNILIFCIDSIKNLLEELMPAIFIGMSITFSGAGIGLHAYDFLLMGIIIIYGALGIGCTYLGKYLEVKAQKLFIKN